MCALRESFACKALGARPWLLHCGEYANDISTKARGFIRMGLKLDQYRFGLYLLYKYLIFTTNRISLLPNKIT